MKPKLFMLLLSLSGCAYGHPFDSYMGPTEFGACMRKIDESKLYKAEKLIKEYEAKVSKLYAAGKLEQAEKLTMDPHQYPEDFATLMAISKCSDLLQVDEEGNTFDDPE